MENVTQITIAIFASVLASSGLWTYIINRSERKDIKTDMLLALGRFQIIYLGTHYIEKGYITQDEFDNLCDNLYCPYEKMGGNGLAKKIMSQVNELPIVRK